MKCGSYKASDTSLKTNYQSLNNKYSSSNLFVPHQANYNKKFFMGANISEGKADFFYFYYLYCLINNLSKLQIL